MSPTDINRKLSPALDSYLSWLEGQKRFNIDETDTSVLLSPSTSSPFLSVVLRTQGKRIGELGDALECLTQQNDKDFEAIVVAHNVDEESLDRIRAVVSEQADMIRGGLWLVKADGGNRSRPLNVGFATARGDYISILDDDDLVDRTWAQAFKHEALAHPGSVIYSFTRTQAWRQGEGDTPAHPLEEPKMTYCHRFDSAEEITDNNCPSIGCAFPRAVFHEIGLHFDESLDTLEDWDFLLRACNVCGLHIHEEPTSTYRLWDRADSSHFVHGEETWSTDRLTIGEKLSSMPLLLLPGSARSLIYSASTKERDSLAIDSRLYIDTGDGFNEEQTRDPDTVRSDGVFSVLEFGNLEHLGHIKQLRFDPSSRGLICMANIGIEIGGADGTIRHLSIGDLAYDGVRMEGDRLVFLKDDPKVVFSTDPSKTTCWVKIRFELSEKLNPKDIDDAIDRWVERKLIEQRTS